MTRGGTAGDWACAKRACLLIHPCRLALAEKSGLRCLHLARLLSQHLDQYVAGGRLDDLGCLVVVGDGNAVDFQHDVTLDHMVGGDRSWLNVADPGMACVPLVVALQDEALRRKQRNSQHRDARHGRHLGQGQRTHFVSTVGLLMVTSNSTGAILLVLVLVAQDGGKAKLR